MIICVHSFTLKKAGLSLDRKNDGRRRLFLCVPLPFIVLTINQEFFIFFKKKDKKIIII